MDTRAQSQKGRLAAAVIRVCCLATLCFPPVLGSACDRPSPVGSEPAVLPARTVGVYPAAQLMAVGDEQEFTAILSEAQGGPRRGEVVWSISDEAVVGLTLRSNGAALVTARAPGWAIITATTGEAIGRATIQVEAQPCIMIGEDAASCREPNRLRPLGGGSAR